MTPEQGTQIRDLYHKEYHRLFAMAYARLGDREDANDAVQQTFAIACQRPEPLLDGPHPEKWLLHTLQRVIYTFWRARAKEQLICREDVPGSPATDPMEQLSLEALFGELAETAEFRLVKAVSVDGMRYEELAGELGISVNACRIRLMRARKFLQEKIKTDEML